MFAIFSVSDLRLTVVVTESDKLVFMIPVSFASGAK